MTSDFNPAIKDIYSVLIDLIAAVDVDGQTEPPDGWAAPFAAELADAGAITKLIDDDYDPPRESYDITPLVTAFGGLVEHLVQRLAAETGKDRLEILSDARVVADRMFE